MGELLLTFLILPLFLLACLFSFLIPGLFLLGILGYKKENNIFILATAVGISLFLLLIYTFSWLQLHFAPLFVLGVVNIFYIIKLRNRFDFKLIRENMHLYGIIALGSLTFIGLTWFSGIELFNTIHFFGINAADGVIHIARIYNFLHIFPPTHPALAGVPFNGYHYFYDLLISRFALFYNFSPTDLYFRFFSLFTSVFFGLSFLALLNRLTDELGKKIFVLFFVYFSVGFSPLLYLVRQGYSAMFADPIFLIFDPSVLLSVGLLVVMLTQLPLLQKGWIYAVVIGVLLGILSQLKVYAGIIGIIALVSYSALLLYRLRQKVFLQVVCANSIAGILTILTFFPNNFGVGGFLFDPLRFYSHYIQQGYLDILQWENRRLTYIQRGNNFLVFILYVLAIGFYWFITLGYKIFILFSSKKYLKKAFWRNDLYLILSIAIAFSFFLPTFFLQSIAAYDIGQLLWIGVLFLSIPAGFILFDLFSKRYLYTYIILGLFILTGALQLLQVYKDTYRIGARYSINSREQSVYEVASGRVKEDEYLVVLPTLRFTKQGEAILTEHPPSLISAMTGRDTYYENEKIEYNLSKIYSERKENLFGMHEALDECDQNRFSDVLKRTGSPYLLVQFQSSCLATHSALLEVASSRNAVLYKLEEK